MTCTTVGKMWKSRWGFWVRGRAAQTGRHEVSVGEASVGQAMGRPRGKAAGRRSCLEGKERRTDARSGRRGQRTWSAGQGPQRGQEQLRSRDQGAGVWGCLGASWGAPRGWEAGEAASGLRSGFRRGALSRRAMGGRVRGLGSRRRQGAARGPRGVSELGSRGAQTPPHCEPRLRGGGRPGPPSASHRRRRRRRLPGLPGPRNAVAVAGGAVPGEGEGAIADGLVSPPQSSFPDGAPCWGIRWQAQAVGSLSPSLHVRLPGRLPMRRPVSVAQSPELNFGARCHLSPPVWTGNKSLNLSEPDSDPVKWG